MKQEESPPAPPTAASEAGASDGNAGGAECNVADPRAYSEDAVKGAFLGLPIEGRREALRRALAALEADLVATAGRQVESTTLGRKIVISAAKYLDNEALEGRLHFRDEAHAAIILRSTIAAACAAAIAEAAVDPGAARAAAMFAVVESRRGEFLGALRDRRNPVAAGAHFAALEERLRALANAGKIPDLPDDDDRVRWAIGVGRFILREHRRRERTSRFPATPRGARADRAAGSEDEVLARLDAARALKLLGPRLAQLVAYAERPHGPDAARNLALEPVSNRGRQDIFRRRRAAEEHLCRCGIDVDDLLGRPPRPPNRPKH